MKELIIISPICEERQKRKRINRVLDFALKDFIGEQRIFSDMSIISALADEGYFKNKNILFAICIGESGINLEYYKLLKIIRLKKNMFVGSVGGILIDGKSELFTKTVGRELAFAANSQGLSLPGRALVEATGNLDNFAIKAMNLNTSNEGAYKEMASQLITRIASFEFPSKAKNILVLHSGQRGSSNTLDLWDMVSPHVSGEIKEISLRNGEVFDCKGCTFEVCRHFGKVDRCYYGGVITKEVYPAITKADALVMLCPNYNDAIGANLTAFINRLTALFLTKDFSRKKVYALIVSGYSGGDILGGQIISALNMNKGFILPPQGILTSTANLAGSLKQIEGIEDLAKKFGQLI